MASLIQHLKNGFAIATVCIATSAQAQSAAELEQLSAQMEGTIFTIPHTESADGMLKGCGLEFAALKRDFSTKKGGPVKLSGSVYFRLLGDSGLGYMLKLGLFDGFGPDPVQSAPANAFLKAPHGKTPKRAVRSNAESAGYALFFGSVDSDVFAAYESILIKKQVVVGFNRKAGQQDVVTTVDLSVVDTQVVDGRAVRTRSDQPVREFQACIVELVKMLKP